MIGLLDYDGTVAFKARPEDAKPTPELIALGSDWLMIRQTMW